MKKKINSFDNKETAFKEMKIFAGIFKNGENRKKLTSGQISQDHVKT